MRINTQFSVAVHILTVLAYFEHEHKDITSDMMARSIGTNPVVVRRIVRLLKKAGLVDVRAGVKCTKLGRPAGAITLLDIYHAVRPPSESLFDLHPNPNRNCIIGIHIKDAVSGPIADAQKAMENRLSSFTLQDIVNSISKKDKTRRH